jgi:transposase
MGGWTTSAVTRALPAQSHPPRKAHLPFLPVYSPELNPIEQALQSANIKREPPSSAHKGRMETPKHPAKSFSPQECANELRNAG